MKKAIYLSLIILSFFAISCSSSDGLPTTITTTTTTEPTTVPITVTLTINVTGTLSDSPSVEYRDEKGELKTEVLTGSWSKSFTVNTGYNLFLKAKGTVNNGNVEIRAVAEGKGISFDKNSNFGGTNQDFDHTIETKLE